MVYRIAGLIGKSVDETLSIRAVEWFGWLEHYDEEPFGPLFDDLRWASLLASVAAFGGAENTVDDCRYGQAKRAAQSEPDFTDFLFSTAPGWQGKVKNG